MDEKGFSSGGEVWSQSKFGLLKFASFNEATGRGSRNWEDPDPGKKGQPGIWGRHQKFIKQIIIYSQPSKQGG